MKKSEKKQHKTVAKVYIVSINNMAIQPYTNLRAAYYHFSSIVLSSATKCISYSAVNRRLLKGDSYKILAPNNIQYSITAFDLLVTFNNVLN